jgi:gas vesicle protein
LQREFWRGLITGSIVGAVMAMIKTPQRKTGNLFDMSNVRRRYPRRATSRMIKDVSKTVNDLMKRK